MKVPQLDLSRQTMALRGELQAALDRVLASSAFTLGEEVASFEQEFAAHVEAKHCIGVNSGTSALHLALLAAGVGPGDEVITTANTFIATAEAITYTGAKPVFVDVDPATANIDPALVAAAISVRTRAIVPVHLYGRPADLQPLLELSARTGIPVIEDACQAHGARYRGRRVGALGLVGAFSFYPTKNLAACGEAGALVTNDDRLAALARSLRSHGESRRYSHDRVGYNYRLEGFQAAVLRVKLKYLPQWTLRRQEIALQYRRLLGASGLQILADDPASECVYHQFAFYVSDRDGLRAELDRRGVSTAVHYPTPIHLQAAYQGLGDSPGSLPHTERACQQVICLPMFPELRRDEIVYVAQAIIEALADSQQG